MRIDGSIPEQAFPKAGRAERITAGDVVQGKIVSTDGGQIQLRLSDGSTLHAKVAEGVNLENGTTVRLQIGEKKEGVPTARILERSAPQSAVSAGAMTPEGEIGEALRNLGEKVLPALMERAVTLQERTGVTAGQAAFLTANNLDGDPAAGAMLARMLNGRFGFSANWTALSSGMADAASALSPENRTALVQSLLLSEQVGKLVDAFLSGTQANAGAAVGADNGSGAAAGAGTTGEAASGTGTTSNAGTGESTPADGSSPGRTLLANPIKDLLMQWAERPPIAEMQSDNCRRHWQAYPAGKLSFPV